jgi:hypothetical protein
MSRLDNFHGLNKYAKAGEKRKTKVRSLETTLSRDPNIRPYLDSNRTTQLDWVNGSNRSTQQLKISDDVIDIRVPLVPAPAFSRNENI